MSEYINKIHCHDLTVSLGVSAKYKWIVFDEQIDVVLKDLFLGVAERHQLKFLENGTDKDHFHFFGAEFVPTHRVNKLVALIKSMTARETFKLCPQIKKKL